MERSSSGSFARSSAVVATLISCVLFLIAPLKAQVVLRARSPRIAGLRGEIELLRDSAGIMHITAQNEHDLFFAQGYSAARDRLFQLELWRRQATGTMAEVLGPRWVARDRASRLLKYRGNLTKELSHYHPRGVAIVSAFVEGVNAWVTQVQRDSTLLPPELGWLGMAPGRWTPEVVISRHNALASNAREEPTTARAVRAIGDAAVLWRRRFEPAPARVAIDSAVARMLDAGTDDALLAVYDAFKNAPSFRPEDVIASVRGSTRSALSGGAGLAQLVDGLGFRGDTDARSTTTPLPADPWESNNWVLGGSRTKSGKPIVANDPHRTITVPSLRYVVHLTAPGWDVIGAGEPALPGVAIGHNRHGAWGLTIFGIDVEDLYTYDTRSSDPLTYRYKGAQERMRVVHDTILVRGGVRVPVTLRFTRHGPVLFEDTAKHVAVALRAAWMEPGGAPYLASLRVDQARSWSEFRSALTFANMPAENWIWGDTSGAIGWQAAGIAPIRKAWDGLVPVPGDGRFEWSGYLPISELPHASSPAISWFGSANAYNVPASYAHKDAIARTWAEPWRIRRLTEVLDTMKRADVGMMQRLQHDETPLAARQLVKLLRGVRVSGPTAMAARDSVLAWNGVLAPTSVGAGVYAMWERALSRLVAEAALPAKARSIMKTVPLTHVIDWMVSPDTVLGANPVATRDSLLARAFAEAVAELTKRFGASPAKWQYGQDGYHHVRIAHPLDGAVNDSLKRWLSPGPIARGGYANTLNATGNTDNQTAGASVRFVMDVSNWDRATMTNTPGQSGDPASVHYSDLFGPWTRGAYAPLSFSRPAIMLRSETIELFKP